ncbi:Plexin-B3 [Pseudolycoriella hygida]|uniref:Plexin-B3 n=1 Tax=Pseudolycoriella hygida TaxID=35572 RepID=A0A9Q0S1B8_9DIPT|nr:Plexin-B3 [Pseudolycoriella hygida]
MKELLVFLLLAFLSKFGSSSNSDECALFLNCAECLTADPFCGWCMGENKCSQKSHCDDSSIELLPWLSSESGKCPIITGVVPRMVERNTSRQIELTVENFPSAVENVVCAFVTLNQSAILKNATKKENVITCYVIAKLSIRTVNEPDISSTPFTFYDCTTYKSCTECTMSQFPCKWCVDSNLCTSDATEQCRNDMLVTGVTTGIRSSGATFCPKISRTTSEGNEILVPNGSKKVIKVRAHIVGSFMVQSRFLCSFIIDGRTITVNGQLLGDTIYCDAIEFSTTSTSQKTVVPFAVLVGRSKQLDNPDNIHVVICQPESCDK